MVDFAEHDHRMSFVVDGSQWAFDNWEPLAVAAALDRVLGFVDVSNLRGEIIWIGDDLQSRSIMAGMDLWTVLSIDGPLGTARELAQEMAAWLGKAPLYLDENQWPPNAADVDVAIGSRPPSANIDVAWAHHWTAARSPVACLGITLSGPIQTVTQTGTVDLSFVVSEQDRVEFWRTAIIICGDTMETLVEYASRAYPYLYFIDSALNGLSHLAGGYVARRAAVRRSFEILNDHGRWVFTCPPPALSPLDHCAQEATAPITNKIIEDRFAGLGLNVAPENPNVYRDRIAREAREVTFLDKILYCEWHIKLEPHRNRIHIHGPIAASFGRVIVAIIHEHLPLP